MQHGLTCAPIVPCFLLATPTFGSRLLSLGEATMVRLHDVGTSGRMWHLIAKFLAGFYPNSLVILPPSLESTRASRMAEYSLLHSSTCSSTPLRHLSAASSPPFLSVSGRTMWFFLSARSRPIVMSNSEASLFLFSRRQVSWRRAHS